MVLIRINFGKKYVTYDLKLFSEDFIFKNRYYYQKYLLLFVIISILSISVRRILYFLLLLVKQSRTISKSFEKISIPSGLKKASNIYQRHK